MKVFLDLQLFFYNSVASIITINEIIMIIDVIINCLSSILILSSHLGLGLPKGLFPVGLPVKILKTLLLSYMPCSSQSSRLNHPDYIR